MPGPDANAQAALRSPVVRPAYLGFLDILDDPIRVTTAPYGIAPTGLGDDDLDGHTFSAVDPELIGVGKVTMKEGGAETVTVTLSGLIGIDAVLMNAIGDKSRWQGRVARLWQVQMNASGDAVSAIWPFFTAYMTVPKIVGDRTGQTITLELESYLSFLTAASGRSYLSQADFDPGDLSAAATITCANGTANAGAPVAAVSSSQATRMLVGGVFQ